MKTVTNVTLQRMVAGAVGLAGHRALFLVVEGHGPENEPVIRLSLPMAAATVLALTNRLTTATKILVPVSTMSIFGSEIKMLGFCQFLRRDN